MFCPRCGKNVPEGSAFCPSCGAEITQRARAPKSSQTAAGAPTAKRRPASRMPQTIEGKGSMPRKLIPVAVVVIAALVILNVIRGIAFTPSGGSQSPVTASPGNEGSEVDEYSVVKVSNASFEEYDANVVPEEMRLHAIGENGSFEYTIYTLTVDLENTSTNSVRADVLIEGTLNWTDGYGDPHSVSVACPVQDFPEECMAPREKRTATMPVFVATKENPLPSAIHEFGIYGMDGNNLDKCLVDGESAYLEEGREKLPDDDAKDIYLSDLTCTRVRATVLDDVDDGRVYLPLSDEVIELTGDNGSGITVLGKMGSGTHAGEIEIASDCMVTNTSAHDLSRLKVAGYVLYDGKLTNCYLTVYLGAYAEYVKAGETAEVVGGVAHEILGDAGYGARVVPSGIDTSKLSFRPTAIVGTLDSEQ